MTGNEFRRKMDEIGVSQKDVAECLSVTPVTISRNIAKGDDAISEDLHRAFAEFAIQRAHLSLKDGLDKLNRLVNGLIGITQ